MKNIFTFFFSFLLVFNLSNKLFAQCASTSPNPWEWPSQRNWFFAPNLSEGIVRDMFAGTNSIVGYPGNPVTSYEGISAASDDQGNLIFYTNGRNLWTGIGAATVLKTNALLEGNENIMTNGSATQGIITVRHPLDPNKYYVFTTDDANGSTLGLNYAVFNKTGDLLSGPTRIGNFRPTEGIAATKHKNGVDIWITVMVSGSINFNTYLLTCSGVNTTPVVSGDAPNVSGGRERGGLAFSWDGNYFAQGHANWWPDNDKKLSVYKFDNATGIISDPKHISDATFGSPYDIIFSPDNKRIYASLINDQLRYYDISSWNAVTMNASCTTTGINTAFSAIEIGADGNLYYSSGVLNGALNVIAGNLNTGTVFSSTVVAGTAGNVSFGLPTMYMPPSEKPVMQTVSDMCDTDAPIDLNTTWWCSGLNAEDIIKNPNGYSGAGITNTGTGIFNPTTAGVGTHTINFNYCSVSDTIEIVVKACAVCVPPVVSTSANASICNGQSTTLTASGGGIYLWSDANTTNSHAVSPSSNTTYTVTVTNSGNTCNATATVSVIVNALPTVSASANKTICIGDAVTLTGSGALTYSWTNPVLNNTPFNPITTATYTVTGTDINSCSNTSSVIITVNALPTVSAGANNTICAGDAVTLTGSGALTYIWTNPVLNNTPFNPITTATYTVTGTDVNSCSNTSSVIITVNALPTVSAGANNTICAGDAVTLTGSGALTYSWTNPVLNNTPFNPITTATYTVTGTDINSCSNTSSVQVSVNALPIVSAGANKSICIGNAVTLTGSGALTYSWTNPVLNNTPFNPITTATYTVTGTDINSCSNTSLVIVTVNTIPVPNVADVSVCELQSKTLTASGGGTYLWSTAETTASISVSPANTATFTVTVTTNGCTATDEATVSVIKSPVLVVGDIVCSGKQATVSTGGGATNYLWSNGVNSPDSSGIHVSPLLNTTYTVTITLSGCTASGTTAVVVNANPVAVIDNMTATICAGETITFSASGGNAYAWNTGAMINTITVNPIVNSTYSVTVTNVSGCSNTEQTTVIIKAGAVPSAGASVSVCNGNAASLTASGGTYVWSTGDTTTTISVSPLTSSSYTVSVTALSGCTATDTVSVFVNALPIANAGPDAAVCAGNSVTLSASGGVLYSWSANANNATLATSTFIPVISDNYSVTVTNAFGCSNDNDVAIMVNPLPTVDAGIDAKICKDYLLPISASLNFNWTYSWTVSAGGAVANANIRQTDASALNPTGLSGDLIVTYTVSVADNKGCSDTDDMTITFEFVCKPRVTSSVDDNAICLGDSTILTASAPWATPLTYTWNPALAGAGPFTIKPIVNTTYYVTVADQLDASKSDVSSIVVQVNPLPVITASASPASICIGAASTLNASGGGVSFIWSNLASTPSTSVSPVADIIYTVTAIDINGCLDTGVTSVHVNPLPTVTLIADSVKLCLGNSSNLSATGGVSYAWSNSLLSTNVISVTPVIKTSYTVTATDVKGCSNTATTSVDLFTMPTANAGNDVGICNGTSASLQASGGATYVWNTGQTSASITPAPTVNTTYSVTVISADKCTNADMVAVTVHSLPVADAGKDTIICQNNVYTIAANSGMQGYNWSTGGTSQLISIKVIDTVTYTVTITDANTCTDSDEMIVTMNPTPTITLNPFTAPLCVNDSPLILASGLPAGGTYSGLGVSGNTFNPGIANSGIHLITYSYTDEYGCSNATSQYITVMPLPVVKMDNIGICQGGVATLNAGISTYMYKWSDDNTNTKNIRNESPLVSTAYTVTVSNGTCAVTESVLITVYPIPTVDFNVSSDHGCQPFKVEFTDNSKPSAISYLWNFGDGFSDTITSKSITHTYLKDGSYDVSLKIITADKCYNSITFPDRIVVAPRPVAFFSFDPLHPSNFDQAVNFTNLSQGNMQNWLWDFGDNTGITSDKQNPSHQFTQPGKYPVKLSVSTDNDCSDDTTLIIYVKTDHTFFMPNAFTPNDDGKNETVAPKAFGIDEPTFGFYVYSRWGEIIHSSIGYGIAWDGRKFETGEILPEDVYTWLVIYKDLEGIEYREVGAIMLLR